MKHISSTSLAPAAAVRPSAGTERCQRHRAVYQRLLDGAFNVFCATRLLTYLPTFWAIWASADSSQHSFWTWGAWMASNATMSAWLYEKNGRQTDKAVVVTLGNSLMCATACVLILAYRW